MNYINKNSMVILGTLLAAALYSSCSESLEDELSPKANMCTVPTDSSHTVTFTDISTLANLDKAKTRSGKAPEKSFAIRQIRKTPYYTLSIIRRMVGGLFIPQTPECLQ